MRTVILLLSAAALATTQASAATLNACVNPASGEIKIAPACHGNSYAVALRVGEDSPAPPPPVGMPTIEYYTGGIYPGTSVARAFCPPGTKVVGGGGITAGYGFGLQQSYPISDETGVIAWGNTAIGWQAAADDFGFAQAFVACMR